MLRALFLVATADDGVTNRYVWESQLIACPQHQLGTGLWAPSERDQHTIGSGDGGGADRWRNSLTGSRLSRFYCTHPPDLLFLVLSHLAFDRRKPRRRRFVEAR